VGREFVVTQKVIDAFYDAEILSDTDHNVRRVVLDLTINEPAVMYIERFLDDDQFRIVQRGIEVVPTAEDAGIAKGRSKTT
jgi:hypothetical protein